MNICITVNSFYIRYVIVMLTSLFENNERGSIRLFVVQRDFTPEDKAAVIELAESFGNTVDYIFADDRIYNDFPPRFLREILFRLRISEYIPEEIDRVLMLDVDLVVNGDLSELYETDMDGYCFAASPNMLDKGQVLERYRGWYPADRKDWTHFNTGVLLWNLKYIRENYPSDYMLEKGRASGITALTFEEELINVEFGEDKILRLDPAKWNYVPVLCDYDIGDNYKIYKDNDELLANCRIMHFARLSPWNVGAKNDTFHIWWEYAKKTPYYQQMLEEIYWATEAHIAKIPNMNEQAENKLRMVDLLLEKDRQGKLIKELRKDGYSRIMIYGAGRIARCMEVALRGSDIEIVCYIDREFRGEFCGRPEIGFSDICNYEADVIIVSNSAYFDEVVRNLSEYTKLEIVPLSRYFD